MNKMILENQSLSELPVLAERRGTRFDRAREVSPRRILGDVSEPVSHKRTYSEATQSDEVSLCCENAVEHIVYEPPCKRARTDEKTVPLVESAGALSVDAGGVDVEDDYGELLYPFDEEEPSAHLEETELEVDYDSHNIASLQIATILPTSLPELDVVAGSGTIARAASASVFQRESEPEQQDSADLEQTCSCLLACRPPIFRQQNAESDIAVAVFSSNNDSAIDADAGIDLDDGTQQIQYSDPHVTVSCEDGDSQDRDGQLQAASVSLFASNSRLREIKPASPPLSPSLRQHVQHVGEPSQEQLAVDDEDAEVEGIVNPNYVLRLRHARMFSPRYGDRQERKAEPSSVASQERSSSPLPASLTSAQPRAFNVIQRTGEPLNEVRQIPQVAAPVPPQRQHSDDPIIPSFLMLECLSIRRLEALIEEVQAKRLETKLERVEAAKDRQAAEEKIAEAATLERSVRAECARLERVSAYLEELNYDPKAGEVASAMSEREMWTDPRPALRRKLRECAIKQIYGQDAENVLRLHALKCCERMNMELKEQLGSHEVETIVVSASRLQTAQIKAGWSIELDDDGVMVLVLWAPVLPDKDRSWKYSYVRASSDDMKAEVAKTLVEVAKSGELENVQRVRAIICFALPS